MKNLLIFIAIIASNKLISQNNISISEIINKLNETSYEFSLKKQNKNFSNDKNLILKKLDSIGCYTIYYLNDEKILKSIKNKNGLYCGFKIVVFSNEIKKGILLSFTRSHIITKINNRVKLKFYADSDLIEPFVLKVNDSFKIEDLIIFSFFNEGLDLDESPYSFIEMQDYNNLCLFRYIKLKNNIFKINIESIFSNICSNTLIYHSKTDCKPIFNIEILNINTPSASPATDDK